jgi:transcription-repair coupling factor (superfamily II helicase)
MFAIRVGESGSIADNLTIEYQRVALHIGRANTQEIMIPSMPEQYRYSLPVKAGDQRQIGELTGAACATLVAEMAERHGGPVVLIAPDMQNALRLNDEIRQFTDSMVAGLADWETLPTIAFPAPGHYLFPSRHPVPAPDDGTRRTDYPGQHPDAARLSA